MTKEMEQTYERGDTEAIYNTVRKISDKAKSFSAKAPSRTASGELIMDQDGLATLWHDFLSDKFNRTKTEEKRDDYKDLGPQLHDDPLTWEAFLSALTRLKTGKACGPDNIPGEVYKQCDAASLALFKIMYKMWQLEYVPSELVRAAFVILYKEKDSVDDPSKYRCIGLLPHSYKLMSIVLLDRISKECSSFLSDWQAGFRRHRGCRDNILLLRVLIDQVIKLNKNICITFIDYSAAFDSISHKFLDKILAAAGASRKTRAIFRAIYQAAEGTARVRGLNGLTIYSKAFKVRRGVIQGDVMSPIFFVLAMEQIFRLYDDNRDGVTLGNHLHIGVLGYADDAALVSASCDKMTTRISNVSKGSKVDADMTINTDKTKNMHVSKQETIAPSTIAEMKRTEQKFEHKCTYCPRRFKTARGLKIHMSACGCKHGLTEEVFKIEKINAVFGCPEHRWFRVQWEGHPGEDSWEPERSLIRQGCSESIRSFWDNSAHNPSEEFIADPDHVWRCWTCGKGYI